MGINSVSSLEDVERIEATGWPTVPASTYDLIRTGAALDPNAPALSFFMTANEHTRPETWDYRRLLWDITRTANAFHRLGAGRDTVIAYVLPNLPETHFVIWGGQAAGIVFAVNPLLEGSAIADLLTHAGATILVTLAPFPGTDLWAKVQPELHRVPSLEHVVLVNLANRVRGPRKMFARLAQRREADRLHGQAGLRAGFTESVQVHDFRSLIRREIGDHLVSCRMIDPDDYSSFFCTGGTTGLPKIAMRRHRNEVANVTSALMMLSDAIGPGKNVFCGLPLFHVNGVLVTGLAPFARGAHVVLGTPQGYRGEGVVNRFWEIVARHRINFFSGVPTLYASLLQHPIGTHDIGSLEYGLCGAAPLPIEVMRRFEASTGVRMLEGYGLTEATCVSTSNPPNGDRRTGSIGLRLPFQQIKTVVLEDDGSYVRDCDVDEVGTIAMCGPNIFAGYRLEEQNHDLWIDRGDGQTWLNTGDLGRVDAEGYFWLVGRKKELIIRGGHNIDPAEIETALYTHPAVKLAAAVGRPDPRAGELPVAYVELKPGEDCTEADLMAHAHDHIGERAARPKKIHIIDAMPLTGVGKIFKPALVDQEIQSAVRTVLHAAGAGDAEIEVAMRSGGARDLVVIVPNGADLETVEQALGVFPFPFAVTQRAEHPKPRYKQTNNVSLYLSKECHD